MAQITFDNVTKRYPDGTEAVTRLDLAVGDGELMILVGPSGCGKSTALRMIAGLEEVSAGELRIGDRVVNDVPPKGRDIAMVFQNYALYPQMSVRGNIGFPLRLARTDRRQAAERVAEVARLMDLVEQLDRRPAQLSGGQRQRVAMGRSIIREPKAFLLDEPLSNLDAKLRAQMRTEISRLQRRLGTTTVYVTHDQVEAMTLGDRVAVMRDGVLQQVGPPRTLYERPANRFVAGFIGSPPMNLMDAEVRSGALELPLGVVALERDRRAALDGATAVVAGLRPEALRAGPAPSTAAGRFRVAVETVEVHGADTFVHAVPEPGREPVVVRLDGAARPAAGDELELWAAGDDLHLFDAASGDALGATGR